MVQGILAVISGPSGCGKGTVCRALLERSPLTSLSISATTRQPRVGEKEGVHYYFVDRDRFKKMIAGGEVLEWAEVYGDYYGTPRRPVLDLLDRGRDVLLEIDVQGARQVKEQYPEAVLIFLYPPSFAELERRLITRGTDSAAKVKCRLEWARREMQAVCRYDYVVVNDRVDKAVAQIGSIMTAEKCRTKYFQGMKQCGET